MKKKLLFVLLASLVLTLAACGGATETPEDTGENAAEAESLVEPLELEITTDNQGEEAQHVNFIFVFDGDASALQAADFSATIAGNPLEAEKISLTAAGEKLTVTLNPTAIKDGSIELVYNGEDAAAFRVDAVVSPGLDLEVAEQDPEHASVTVRVCEPFHIRGMARVMLLENGEPVMTAGEEPSSFTAVHGHEFLAMDEAAIAEKVALSLSESFPEGYEISASGDTVTVVKQDAQSPTELELVIEHWEKLEVAE